MLTVSGHKSDWYTVMQLAQGRHCIPADHLKNNYLMIQLLSSFDAGLTDRVTRKETKKLLGHWVSEMGG